MVADDVGGGSGQRPSGELDRPADALSVPDEDGWTTYQPETPGVREPGKVTITLVTLLLPEDEIAARTSVDDLAAFGLAVERCAQQVFDDRDEVGELQIRLLCTPAGHDIRLASRGELSPSGLAMFAQAVEQLPTLPVHHGEVSFVIEIAVPGKVRRCEEAADTLPVAECDASPIGRPRRSTRRRVLRSATTPDPNWAGNQRPRPRQRAMHPAHPPAGQRTHRPPAGIPPARSPHACPQYVSAPSALT